MTVRLLYSKLGLAYERGAQDAPNAIRGFRGKHRVLSNFFMDKFVLGGLEFHSSEQGYMLGKSDDVLYRRSIMAAPTPSACKRLGYAAILLPEWDERLRYERMFEVLMAKFERPYAKRCLLDTGTAYLEETNFHGDTHWGRCNGKGFNHLGRLLMCVRYIKGNNS